MAFWRKFVYLNRWRVRVLRILVLFLVRLIYYPMIVLSLLILARNTAFDNWALTPALLIVYCIFVSVNGAFARFSQQSLVRSVLLKIGSVGGTSLLELSALMNF